MPSPQTGPRWHAVVAPRWLAWHAFTIAAVIGMLWLGDWQFRRAESGNALSWAYTFEWPVFAVFAIVFWVKTVMDELKPKLPGDRRAAEPELPAALGDAAGPSRPAAGGAAEADAEDRELAAYNAYLARLNQQVQGHGRWHGLR
jgi:hypothetical protein